MSGSNKKSSGRLGTRLRGKLQEDYDLRGKSRYALWCVYSPKSRADVVQHGDLRYGHFLHVESDPTVKSVDYKPRERVARIVGTDLGECVDAEVHLADGTIVWRCVRSSEASRKLSASLSSIKVLIEQRVHRDLPVRIEIWTDHEIYAQPQRIQNWNRLVPWLAQAREWPLHQFGNEVAALLHSRHELLLRDVMAIGDEEQRALYVAALLHGVQFGHFQSDLNERPWSMRSRFFVATEAP